ncbi:MAG: hypothetical protein QGH15_23980, partial [Kiritimatiellia bacterium]|nr:hypothetical protein [Kiritimatiellia bacterium]
EDYVKGFMSKAAELGVDPEELVKSGGLAQLLRRGARGAADFGRSFAGGLTMPMGLGSTRYADKIVKLLGGNPSHSFAFHRNIPDQVKSMGGVASTLGGVAGMLGIPVAAGIAGERVTR